MKNRIKFIFLWCVIALFTGCTSLPSRDDVVQSYVINPITDSAISEAVGNYPKGLSGFYPLSDGLDAFVARLALIENAEVSIDIQYYLFNRQQTTTLFTAYLLAAANRGVRVRLLLDDMSQADSEFDLVALAQHPNFEIRLFNPFPNRAFPSLGFLTNYTQLSKRMHNKSFIVDNAVFITGGRNIGNAYFAAEDRAEFIDLDVMTLGSLVNEASSAFDIYWNHKLAYPVELLNSEPTRNALNMVSKQLADYVNTNQSSQYIMRLKQSELVSKLKADELQFDWQKGLLFYDLPDKILSDIDDRSTHMTPALLSALGEPNNKVIIVSPYFVPTEKGVEILAHWVKNGVKVTVLTNSLAATDVSAVHAGYMKYRIPLLQAGVALWELKPSNLAELRRKNRGEQYYGSSLASLHAKTVSFDDNLIFIGSLNLDPRSFYLNTEMGVLAHSKQMSENLSEWVEQKMPEFAWKLKLKSPQSNQIIWEDILQEHTFNEEPLTSSLQRLMVWFISLFPVEDAL